MAAQGVVENVAALGVAQKGNRGKTWKERGRKETRTGRKRYDRKQDHYCRVEGCRRLEPYKERRSLMMHLVKEHPKSCTEEELRHFRDKRDGTVECRLCHEQKSKSNMSKHVLACRGRPEH